MRLPSLDSEYNKDENFIIHEPSIYESISTKQICLKTDNIILIHFKWRRYSIITNVRLSVCPSAKGETRFSRPLFKIEVCFFLCTFLIYMSTYSTNISSVGLSVRQKCKNIETWYSWRLFKIEVWFFFLWKVVLLLCISSMNILSVSLSVRL